VLAARITRSTSARVAGESKIPAPGAAAGAGVGAETGATGDGGRALSGRVPM
jgi:hypothetical protein